MGWVIAGTWIFHYHLVEYGGPMLSDKLLIFYVQCKFSEYCIWYWFFHFWYSDIALVKLARYMGRNAVSGVVGPSASMAPQNEDVTNLLEDIHCRCERLLITISGCSWQHLEDQYIQPFIGLPSEWRGVMRGMAMVEQGMCDLWAARAEPLARDSRDSD